MEVVGTMKMCMETVMAQTLLHTVQYGEETNETLMPLQGVEEQDCQKSCN